MDHDTNLKSGDCVISNSCPVAFLLFPLTTAYKKVTLRDCLSTVFGPKKCISSDESAPLGSFHVQCPHTFLRLPYTMVLQLMLKYATKQDMESFNFD